MSDIEDCTQDISKKENVVIAKKFIEDLIDLCPEAYDTEKHLNTTLRILYKKHKVSIGKRWLSHAYKELSDADPGRFPKNHPLRYAVIKNAVRSSSGIVNITVVMPPDRFSCKYNC